MSTSLSQLRTAARSTIRKVWSRLTARYVVEATYYDPATKSYKFVIHYARNWDDAVEWMACYQHGDLVDCYDMWLGVQSHELVASRGYAEFQGLGKVD